MGERLLTPNDDGMGWLRGDAKDLDAKLRNGDGLGWPGDKDLYLAQGVVEETRGGRPTGKILARRWEVWRYCEDGQERMIGHWRMEEFDRIIFDLVRMRADSPSHVNVADALDAADAKIEKDKSDQTKNVLGSMMDHMAWLAAQGQGRVRPWAVGEKGQ